MSGIFVGSILVRLPRWADLHSTGAGLRDVEQGSEYVLFAMYLNLGAMRGPTLSSSRAFDGDSMTS